MELTFLELRAKEVVNTQDGKKLGRVCDIALCYPENKWVGIIVPGGRGFSKKNNLFIDLRNIVKIGEDVILVNIGFPKKQNCAKRGHGAPFFGNGQNLNGMIGAENGNRNFEEYE